MKSTTGAYGSFPGYYYERGNLFGSFLRGGSARKSWDTLKELEVLGSGGPAIHVRSPGEPRVRRFQTPLAQYVHRTFGAESAELILRALGGTRAAVDGDVFAALDAYVVAALSPAERETVQRRLEEALALAGEKQRAHLREQRRRVSGGKKAPTKKRRGNKRAEEVSREQPAAANGRPPSTRNSGPKVKVPPPISRCSMCPIVLSEEERTFSARNADVFLGHGYCMEHGRKLLALFQPESTAPSSDVDNLLAFVRRHMSKHDLPRFLVNVASHHGTEPPAGPGIRWSDAERCLRRALDEATAHKYLAELEERLRDGRPLVRDQLARTNR